MDLVCKFGGTALSSAENITKIAKIVKNDSARKYVVVSAMGKAFATDVKVTDLLIELHRRIVNNCDFSLWDSVADKYVSVSEQLEIPIDMRSLTEDVLSEIRYTPDYDFVVSRGEYLSAKMMAALLGFEYVEAAECVRFFPNGKTDNTQTEKLIAQAVSDGQKGYVMGGFYGSDGQKVRVFPRGGSDVSGALFAAAVNADVYENWTDVDGFFVANPEKVMSPTLNPCLSYEQLRVLSSLGARVLHSDTVLPVREKNIPINIRNFYKPHMNGSMILPVTAAINKICGIVSEEVFVYNFEKETKIPDNVKIFFRSCSPKNNLLIVRERLDSDCFCGSFSSSKKALVGIVFHGVSDMTEKVTKLLKGIDFRLLSSDESLMLLLVDTSNAHSVLNLLNSLA